MSALEIIALICGIIGILGSIVPGIPGPPVSWIGLLLIFIAGKYGYCEQFGTGPLFIWLAIVIVVTVIDFFVPAWLTKATGGHKQASWGALIGLFAGMTVAPVGIFMGSFLGALIGEWAVARQRFWPSVLAALGTFLGLMLGTGIKLVTSVIILYRIIVYIF